MSKSVYIACSYQNREKYLPLIDSLKEFFDQIGWDTNAPVYDFDHIPSDNYKLIMEESFSLLKKSSLLIAEATEKNIGIGIEVGFAKALVIPIVYLRKQTAMVSTTLKGTADIEISYDNLEQVRVQVEKYLGSLEKL